jgi:hypothetical protein
LQAALPLFVSPLLAQSVPEAPEPNDTPLTATHYMMGEQAFGAIDVAGDKDWWVILLEQPADLRAMTAPGFGVDVKDTIVSLLDAAGNPMGTVNDDFPGRGYYSQITVGNLPAGTYYLEVAGYSTRMGAYTLDVYAAPVGDLVPVLAPVAEGPEPNDVRLPGGVATPSLLQTRNNGNIAVGGEGFTFLSTIADYDFYEVAVAAPNTNLTISTLATPTLPAGTFCSDTCIFLVDPAMTVLASNDDSGGLFSRLSYVISTPGIYYAVVKGYGPTHVGDYLLDITGVMTLATFTEHAGGCPGSAGTPHLGTRPDGLFGYHMELPLLGTEFIVDVTNLPWNAPLFQVIGLTALPAPGVDLGPLGASGCFVEVNPAANVMAVSANGFYFWRQRLPYDLNYVGLPLEMQAVVLDAYANPLNVTVSNRGTAIASNNY